MYPSRANSGVIIYKLFHVKLRKISDITATLPFTEFDFMQKYRESFAVSELGRIYAQLPLKEMEVNHRIVSIDRPYIKSLVRGKENKRVEFGAKVNNIQIDGISFIEHHSFEAFNEGVRLKECIEYPQELTGTNVTGVGADTIYANNVRSRVQ